MGVNGVTSVAPNRAGRAPIAGSGDLYVCRGDKPERVAQRVLVAQGCRCGVKSLGIGRASALCIRLAVVSHHCQPVPGSATRGLRSSFGAGTLFRCSFCLSRRWLVPVGFEYPTALDFTGRL